MVKIASIDEEVLKNIPNVLELLYEIYGPSTIGLFAVLNEQNKLSFVARHGGDCVYIDENCHINFTLNENEDLGAIRRNGFEVFFGEDTYYVDKNKVEYHLDLYKLDEPDQDDYDGCVAYKQYNPENDTLCELRFQHMYREMNGVPIIYSYHTKKIDCAYIDEEFTKKARPTKGILPKRSKYYTKVEFDNEMLGYKLTSIREYGLVEFLMRGPYELQMERDIVRYAKTTYIDGSGNYHDFWPFGEQLKPKEIEDMIKSYGFNVEIPMTMIDIHNGRDEYVNYIKEIVEQMKPISKQMKETQDSDKVAMLTLKNE